MRAVAIIPARGGSKGIPGKNIKVLNGKPLIAWTIEAAKRVPEIQRVIVNTDDEGIADVAKQYGADVYMRSPLLAGDDTLDLPVFEDHLKALLKEGDAFEIIVDLRATAPLRTSARISEGIQLLQKMGSTVDSVRALVRASKHPYKMWNFDGTFITPFLSESRAGMPEPYNMPRQKLPNVYQNNGAMNAFWPATVLEKHSMTGDRIAGFIMDDWESINIDTPLDFMLAEAAMKMYTSQFAR